MVDNLEGVFAAAVTPFTDQERPAPEQLQKHLSYLEAKGCNGVLVCGTTGEAASLSVTERILMFKAAYEAGTKLKLLAGTGAASLEDAVELTRAAFDIGMGAVVVIPPYFYRDAPLEGLCQFYASLLRRAVPEDGRVLLYHNPIATITDISFELIFWLCDHFPDQINGIKDSSSNLDHGIQLTTKFPHLRVFVGDDRLLASTLEAGGAGAITGLANVFPDMLRDVYQLFQNGKPTSEAQNRLSETHAQLNGLPRLAAIKMLLSAGHVISDARVRPPLRGLTPDELDVLSKRFNLGLNVPQSLDLSELSQ
jgi:4-hydroxy-tetrahydrodipicolinate synthase